MNKLYEYRQNNSHGKFVGPQYIYIEADSHVTANLIAPRTEIYFNGVQSGIDCDCCGDRWSKATDYNTNHFFTTINFTPDVTKQDLIEHYPEELYHFFRFDFEESTIKFYLHNQQVITFTFTITEKQYLNQLHLDTRKQYFGFAYHPNWKLPSEVHKVYQSDFNQRFYYDLSGNNQVVINTTGPGKVVESQVLYLSFDTENEAIKARDKFILALKDVNKTVQLAVLNQKNLDKELQMYLVSHLKLIDL